MQTSIKKKEKKKKNSYHLILYNDQFHNNNVNQVSNAGILIDWGNLSERIQRIEIHCQKFSTRGVKLPARESFNSFYLNLAHFGLYSMVLIIQFYSILYCYICYILHYNIHSCPKLPNWLHILGVKSPFPRPWPRQDVCSLI